MKIEVGKIYKMKNGNSVKIESEESTFSPVPWDFTGREVLSGDFYHFRTSGRCHEGDQYSIIFIENKDPNLKTFQMSIDNRYIADLDSSNDIEAEQLFARRMGVSPSRVIAKIRPEPEKAEPKPKKMTPEEVEVFDRYFIAILTSMKNMHDFETAIVITKDAIAKREDAINGKL